MFHKHLILSLILFSFLWAQDSQTLPTGNQYFNQIIENSEKIFIGEFIGWTRLEEPMMELTFDVTRVLKGRIDKSRPVVLKMHSKSLDHIAFTSKSVIFVSKTRSTTMPGPYELQGLFPIEVNTSSGLSVVHNRHYLIPQARVMSVESQRDTAENSLLEELMLNSSDDEIQKMLKYMAEHQLSSIPLKVFVTYISTQIYGKQNVKTLTSRSEHILLAEVTSVSDSILEVSSPEKERYYAVERTIKLRLIKSFKGKLEVNKHLAIQQTLASAKEKTKLRLTGYSGLQKGQKVLWFMPAVNYYGHDISLDVDDTSGDIIDTFQANKVLSKPVAICKTAVWLITDKTELARNVSLKNKSSCLIVKEGNGRITVSNQRSNQGLWNRSLFSDRKEKNAFLDFSKERYSTEDIQHVKAISDLQTSVDKEIDLVFFDAYLHYLNQ